MPASPRPSLAPLSRRTERTHQRLVRATRDVIAESGSFTAERVSARAGLSPATFYVYFPNKDEALVGAFSSVLDDLVDFADATFRVERLLEHGLEPLSRLWAREVAGFFEQHTLVFRCALARLPESAGLRASYREHEQAVFERYARFIDLGQRAGRIREGHPTPLARGLLVLTQGLNNPLVLGRDPADPLFDELGRSLCALLAPGAEGG
ncbi:MAG: TetR/AcrR family transcriptional regulator [Myxococcota bacterium]